MLLTLAGCAPGGGTTAVPDVIALPDGFQPEGITSDGTFLYVGSIPTGAVYRADFTDGTGSVLVPAQVGRAAIGLKVDGRGRLFLVENLVDRAENLGTGGQVHLDPAVHRQLQLLDRLVHQAYRLTLKGESLRKIDRQNTPNEHRS